jgi:hypothetical protein
VLVDARHPSPSEPPYGALDAGVQKPHERAHNHIP